MQINTKFRLGQEVYAVYIEETDGIVRIFRATIEQIILDMDDTMYYLDKLCEEFKENELVPLNEPDELVSKINELLEEWNNEKQEK